MMETVSWAADSVMASETALMDQMKSPAKTVCAFCVTIDFFVLIDFVQIHILGGHLSVLVRVRIKSEVMHSVMVRVRGYISLSYGISSV